jgi:hypothetical protein
LGSIAWLVEGASASALEERLYMTGGGALCLVSALVGLYGALARSRTALLVFFINQLWVRALCTAPAGSHRDYQHLTVSLHLPLPRTNATHSAPNG